MISAGITLFAASFAVILEQNPSKNAKLLHALAILSGVISGVFSVFVIFNLCHLSFETWMLDTFGLTSRDAYVYCSLLFCGLVAIVSLIGFRKSPHKASKNSKLNQRQCFQVLATSSILIFIAICLWKWSYSIFTALVFGVLAIVEIGSLFYWLYDPCIYVVSKIFHPKTNAALKPTPNRLNRFGILICAHNEELVIEQLINSLNAMDYPRTNFDIYVICDNCRDETADIVAECGATPLVRNDLSRRGKNEALRWACDVLSEDTDKDTRYDAYVFLNADNLVNEKYLTEINAHLNQGHEVMQTYLTGKNPGDSWVSLCSSIELCLGNSNYQKSHSSLNLSPLLKGSGMVIRPEVLKQIPWGADSLSEELTFTSEYLLQKNRSCHWVHDARFYDERPITFNASLRQRTRLMQGHVKTLFDAITPLFFSSIRCLSFKQFDLLLYLLKPIFVAVSLIVYSLRLLFALVFPGSFITTHVIMSFHVAIFLSIMWLIFHTYTLYSENKLRYALWLPAYFIHVCTWSLPIFRGIIKRNENFWVSTFHARTLAIDDISEDVSFNEARQRLSGLENLHQLPLGQILLKAALITGNQLETALAIQRRNGGFLGNILIDNHAISEDVLATCINIQQTIRASADDGAEKSQTLQLGEILLDAELLTPQQLQQALEYQYKNNGKLGEAVIALQMLSEEALSIFLEVQNLIGANYLDNKMAHEFLQAMASTRASNNKELEALLLASDLVSKQQIQAARKHQDTHQEGLVETLLFLGYLTPEQVKTLRSALSVRNTWPIYD